MAEQYPAISIIVPVYKVEPYLRRCLDSLLNQNFRNYEVIVVDDGSPDGCGAICDEYAKKDSRFRVFHKENGGLSSARNYGMEQARGEYLMFVDSDDWVEPDFCRIPYYLAKKKGADLVMFDYNRVDEKKRILTAFSKYREGYKTYQQAMDMILGSNRIMVWNKMFQRKVIEGLRFPEGVVYEDSVFTPIAVARAMVIYYTDYPLYSYYIRQDSISHNHTFFSVSDYYHTGQHLALSLRKTGYSEKKIKSILYNRAMVYLIAIGRNESPESVQAYNLLRAPEKDCSSNRAFFRKISDVYHSFYWRRKILYFFLCVSPTIFDKVCILFGKRISGSV